MNELGKDGVVDESHESVVIQNWWKNHFVEPRVYVFTLVYVFLSGARMQNYSWSSVVGKYTGR
jgi:hypothetical protein